MQKFNFLFFKNLLHQLEDIAIISTAQDPRLNTVECVVEGHGSFDVKIFSGFRKLLMHVCWLIAFISVVVGYLGSNMFVERLNKTTDEEVEESEERNEKKCKTVALKFLLLDVLAIPEVILLVVALFVVLAVVPDDRGIACLYPVMYLFVILVTLVVYYCKCTEVTDGRKIRLRNTLIHFTFQTSVHHLLWILLGVMTEPRWAIPVLVMICGILFLINLLAYYYMKTTSNNGPRYNKRKLKKRACLLVLSVILEFLVLMVVTQSVLGTDPVIGIISAALTTLVSWWTLITFKYGTGSARVPL